MAGMVLAGMVLAGMVLAIPVFGCLNKEARKRTVKAMFNPWLHYLQ